MLNTVYQTLIPAHTDYCITVWAFAPVVHIDRIQRIAWQCRAARLMSGIFVWNVYIRGIDITRRFNWVANCKGAAGLFYSSSYAQVSYTHCGKTQIYANLLSAYRDTS